LSNPRSDLIVFAIGGNALVRSGEIGTFEGQYHNVQLAVKQIVEFMKRDNCRNSIVLTPGNGPQVGATLVRIRLADDYYPAMPLYVRTAETRESGSIGPKVQASISSIRNGGREAIIFSLKHLSDVLSGVFETHFFR
jgi:carbamate kinase